MRRKPFSAKQKKEQLKTKRMAKREAAKHEDDNEFDPKFTESCQKVKNNPMDSSSDSLSLKKTTTLGGKGRLKSRFAVWTDEMVSEGKAESRKVIDRLPDSLTAWAHVNSEGFSQAFSMPERPPWHRGMSKEQLERNEEQYFSQWLDGVMKQCPREELNFFEVNLDVWRQLWRVIERSQIVLLVVDARHPWFHFPPTLYDYVVHRVRKPLLLVLNKIDLVPPELLDAWDAFFESRFPELIVLGFSSFPRSEESGALSLSDAQKLHRKIQRRKYNAVGGPELLSAIVRICAESPSLNAATVRLFQGLPQFEEALQVKESNHMDQTHRIRPQSGRHVESNFRNDRIRCVSDGEQAKKVENADEDEDEESTEEGLTGDLEESPVVDDEQHEERTLSFLTVGIVGHPNVGKSSLINGLVGKKVVSSSISPGHTKHLQTIFLPGLSQLRLCDCPGLMFPARMSRQMQILCGLFPIAQAREPYSSVALLAQHVPLESVYGLQLPRGESAWTGWLICEAFSLKRGYLTASGNADVYRGANEILRDCLAGRVVLCFSPPPIQIDRK